MGLRFRKSIKLGDLFKINISKSGISATVGKKGASVNIGKKGAYLNVSPAAIGIKGTGVSYRQRIVANPFNDSKKKTKEKDISVKQKETKTIEEVNTKQETNLLIHKYANKVLTKSEFKKQIDSLDLDSTKEMYQAALNGDEDTIESLVGSFLNNINLDYDVKANYELEDNVLYIDLDLPEIEDLKCTKQEYANTIISLGIYLTSNFFNVSSFIDVIVLSAFTTKRNSIGDLIDDYLYSVKYTRDTFEKTDLNNIDDVYKFLLQFENRINMTSTYSFKEIKPYEMESVVKKNSLVDDAIAGLKGLGYKSSEINEISEQLREKEFDSAGEYLKEGIKLLNNGK